MFVSLDRYIRLRRQQKKKCSSEKNKSKMNKSYSSIVIQVNRSRLFLPVTSSYCSLCGVLNTLVSSSGYQSNDSKVLHHTWDSNAVS